MDTSNLVVVYRIYCKAMNTVAPGLKVENLIKDPRGDTTIFEHNTASTLLNVPQRIKMSQVNFPLNWNLRQIAPPRIPKEIAGSSTIRKIKQQDDGSVILEMDRNRFKESWDIDVESIKSSEGSTSSRKAFLEEQLQGLQRIPSRHFISSAHEVIGIKDEGSIARPVYKGQTSKSKHSAKITESKSPGSESSTESDMNFAN